MAIIFIMKKLAKSHPLLSSMLSTPDKVIDITNKTLDDNGQEVTTDGHPDLDPIWIQAAHLQLAANDWSKMTFDPAFGLETAPPKPPGPVQNQLPFGQLPKPSGPNIRKPREPEINVASVTSLKVTDPAITYTIPLFESKV